MTQNKTLQHLGRLSQKLINGCAVTAHNETTLFTPDGIASYNALWLRDFAYMVEYAGEYISDEQIIGCVEFALSGKRADGWLPDRIYADGLAVYAAGEVGEPVGEANLDNTPFLVFSVYTLLNRIDQQVAAGLYQKWREDLQAGVSILPLSKDGLVYNDPEKPHSPYGFTDTVAKTGELFMESLLLWRACRMLDDLERKFKKKHTDIYEKYAQAVENNIHHLYDPSSGMFFAASQDCRQIDIWGNAYLLYIGFPSEEIRDGILSFFASHIDEYCYKGQIRHLPKGEYWKRLLIHIPREEYQNGAYWATASGWVLWCLAQTDTAAAAQLLRDLLDSFEKDGVFECLNEGYAKLDSFVVSATNVYGAIVRLLAPGQCTDFSAVLDKM